MDFICACLLLFLWYVRPQDIFAIISGVSLVKYLMYAGIVATIRRPAGFSVSKLFATPMDWLVAAYCIWAVWVTPEHTATAKEVFTYFSFHVVTALALTSWKKIEIYINAWLGCLGILALLAISTHLGFELVEGSQHLTTVFHDRLTLNTWIFRNPNALGHGVLALIPAGVAWFMMDGGKNRLVGILLVLLACYCVYLTKSKGAFVAGAGGLTLVFLFKRPIWFQLVVLLFAYGVGLAVLMSLPRMDTLSSSDEGIQGRMIVWQQAKASMEASTTGAGLKGFFGYVTLRDPKMRRTIYLPIATHGSYVRNGADLGFIGLMLYAGIFYGGARLLIQGRTLPGSRSMRVQRTVYALMITTAVSSWVVDRAYHMDYFLLTGLLSAFHRRFLPPEKNKEGEEMPDEDADDDDETEGQAAQRLALPAGPRAGTPPAAPAFALPQRAADADVDAKTTAHADDGDDEQVEEKDPEPDRHGLIKLKWRRLGVFDFVAMYVLLHLVLYYWELFSTDFLVF